MTCELSLLPTRGSAYGIKMTTMSTVKMGEMRQVKVAISHSSLKPALRGLRAPLLPSPHHLRKTSEELLEAIGTFGIEIVRRVAGAVIK